MIIPVILSGGAGTRLWPISREAHPKPFIRLPDGRSLLQKTFLRALSLSDVEEILTVTNRDYYFMTKDEYLACEEKVKMSFLLEPTGRNTAPAIALSAMKVADVYGAQTQMLVLPADHLISDQSAFSSAVEIARALAEEGRLVTFGIKPSAPETAFGYIEAGDILTTKAGLGRTALRFVEKPDTARATDYLSKGNFYWNSGMFCFEAGTLVSAMKDTCPDILASAQACWSATLANTSSDSNMIELHSATFSDQPDISIDYALMEKAKDVALVPCDIGWSDIGSWNALSNLVNPDEEGNRSIGDAIMIDSKGTFVHSEHHLVAAVGVEDLIIVNTQDAVLVAHKDRCQEVKQVVTRLKKHGNEAYRLHRTVFRPWGTYTVLEEGKRFKIKRIEVKPGASLSLQMHHHRNEHWIVVSGMAKVVIDDKEMFVNSNESTYIQAGHRHRLENPGLLDLVMIEIQCGDYLGEDDIVRFDDIYGRK